MPTIRLHPTGHTLTFDLKEILAAMGPHASALYWKVGDVELQGGGFDAAGEGAAILEDLLKSGERITTVRFTEIAEKLHQVI